MIAERLSQFYENLNSEGIYLNYQGPLRQELLEELNEIVKKKIETQFDKATINKYRILLVEMVQNIIRYSSSFMANGKEKDISQGVILLGLKEDLNFIMTGNMIDQYHKSILEESLDKLDGCNKKELNILFQKQLRGGTHQNSKGAGLGLIDIYRKADTVEYAFTKNKNDENFFALKVEFSS